MSETASVEFGVGRQGKMAKELIIGSKSVFSKTCKIRINPYRTWHDNVVTNVSTNSRSPKGNITAEIVDRYSVPSKTKNRAIKDET